jgi:EAL domain-containing protein (putative c-di-GMP-specific phosphodiesterase class I)
VFDAVLSDVRMPDMDGIGLLRAVREQDLDVPIVLMTGAPTLETAIQAVEQGALQYLVKPVPLQALLESSRRAVRLGTLARLKREALQTIGLEQVAGDRAGAEASFARAMGGLWIAYQPIVHSSDGSLFGHEALLRAADSYPGLVLTLAERLGRLPDLGARIRDEVAAQLDANPGDELMFVNLHPMDLGDDALLSPHAALSRHASRVVLEVTERASLEGLRGVGERIRALRALGYRIALDDLGAGYAGLTSFATLAPDFVKLDRALMRDLDRHPIKRKLVDSMARLCADMEVRVVAEGIETDGERDGAIQAGCDLLQGFLIGSPAKLTPP